MKIKNNEDILIECFSKKYSNSVSTKLGIGDDCAVIYTDKKTLITTDAIVEGTHFIRGSLSGYTIGWKAFTSSISDIAAMGGVPTHATVTLGLPQKIKKKLINNISTGLSAVSKQYNVDIVGGDIVKSDVLFISITVLGKTQGNKAITRLGTCKGDSILVTGYLGSRSFYNSKKCIPRIQEGVWLNTNYPIHAMIDISDGLYKDMTRILKTGISAELYSSCIPAGKHNSCVSGRDLLTALYQGEDYELLFTAHTKTARRIIDNWPFKKVQITIIGKIIEQGNKRVYLVNDNTRELLTDKSYVHI